MTPMRFVLGAVMAGTMVAFAASAAAEDGVLSIAGEGGSADTAGTVEWSAGTDAAGLPTVIAVARFGGALSVRLEMYRNRGAPVPASHLIEVGFSPGGDFGAGGVSAMLRIAGRVDADETGTAFVGAIARAGQNTFMLALNDTPAGVDRNAALAATSAYWDLVLVDESARAVVVTLEVGAAGAEAVRAAFSARDGN